MILNLSSDFDKQKFRTYCDYLIKKGTWVEIKEIFPQRSVSQNAYLHVCIRLFAIDYGVTEEEAKLEFFKKKVNRDIFVYPKPNKYGEIIETVRSTASLDKKEMTIAIERFRNWYAEKTGLYIPEPNEREKLLEAKKLISLHMEYL